MSDTSQGFIDVCDAEGRIVPLVVQGHTIVPRERLAANVLLNMERGTPRFLANSGRGIRQDEPIAIISGGPSLAQNLDRVRGFRHIIACGSVHDYLRRQGIVPTYAAVSDAGKDDRHNLALAHPDTTFLLASQCDPGLYEHLKGHKVEMWHYAGQAADIQSEEEARMFRGERTMTWGGMVTLSAISLALQMGFQHHHHFGFDGSYGDHGLKSHVEPVAGGKDYDKVLFTVPADDPNGRRFISDMNFAEQANQYFRLVEYLAPWVHSHLYGDGMTVEMVKCGDPGLATFITLME